MGLMTQIALGLAMGIVFGIALEKSRVFEPGVIVGQMQLRNFLMLKIFLVAVVTGLVVLAVLNGGFGVKLHPKGLDWQANLFGGLILGAGIALAGACPGTTLAQIGAGYKDAWFTLAGGIAGAMAFGYTEPAVSTLLPARAGKVTYDALAGLPFWVTALILAVLLAAMLVGLERAGDWRDEAGKDVDGLRPLPAKAKSGPAKMARA
ncbi:MAG: YeeE/YedE thiosulfate transporter family protein [Hyphomicrobiales bacterium]